MDRVRREITDVEILGFIMHLPEKKKNIKSDSLLDRYI